MNHEILKKEFVPKYLSHGQDKFYKFLLVYAMSKLIAMEKKEFNGIPPNLEFLDYYDQFIILYRREGEDNLLEIARIFRKAAHKVYRVMLKKDLTNRNDKFLNLV